MKGLLEVNGKYMNEYWGDYQVLVGGIYPTEGYRFGGYTSSGYRIVRGLYTSVLIECISIVMPL